MKAQRLIFDPAAVRSTQVRVEWLLHDRNSGDGLAYQFVAYYREGITFQPEEFVRIGSKVYIVRCVRHYLADGHLSVTADKL